MSRPSNYVLKVWSFTESYKGWPDRPTEKRDGLIRTFARHGDKDLIQLAIAYLKAQLLLRNRIWFKH